MTQASDINVRKPRIILLMQFYDPEPVYKGQAFAEAIAKAGYEVEVVTGFPNYPGGKVYDGYRMRPIQRSQENGVAITRLALYPSHDKSKIGRVLNYVSFMLSAFFYLTVFARRANLVYAYHPPLTVGLAAAAARIFRRNPVVVDIHDLWPDTLPATGMISNPRILKMIEMACNWMYRRVQHIVLHSHGFRDELLKRGVPAEKMTTVIGWTHEPAELPVRLAVPDNMKDLSGLKILYAGNVGPAQALDSVLDAAHMLQSEGQSETATFCILGSGLALDSLKDKARSLGLEKVVFLPRVSPAEVEAYLAAADVLLMHLRDTPLFALNMPSKAQAYMLAAKPILMGVRGEVKKLLIDAQAGVSVPPENPRAMADAVLSLAAMPADERNKLGQNACAYYWRELCMETGMAKFMAVFDNTRLP
jgi:glycosyltransferase involved in cell wall biosynthesis